MRTRSRLLVLTAVAGLAPVTAPLAWVGTKKDSLVPVKVVDGAGEWSSDLVARYVHTCGLGANHTLWRWGFNTYGEVGSPVGRGSVLPAQVKLP